MTGTVGEAAARPVTQPLTGPVTGPVTRPVTRPVSQPVVRATAAGLPANRVDTPRSGRVFPDPAVAAYRGGLVAVATGPDAPRMVATAANAPWHRAGRALARKPDWASGAGVWGVDLVHVGHRWLLYFAAPVRGLGAEGRCVGVAVSRTPLGRFTPVGRPLVCPRGARKAGGRLIAPAPDRVRSAGSRLPRRGVIDPSVFRSGRRLFLVYKTQGIPSTIRLVRLTGGGLHAVRTSHELIRVGHIVENPVLLRQGRRFVLLTSEGSYADCGYRTTWRASTRLLPWSGSRPRVLLGRGSGVCGPGGADVVVRHAGPVVFFHGWACGRFAAVCPPRALATARTQSRRTLYAARLVWRQGRPHLRPLPARRRAADAPTPMIQVKVHRPHRAKHARHPRHASRR
ncbi:hypothetical protein AB3X52_00195 [Nocardioides sp. DS6]|uniref:Glycoside hydrolase n=1 Tax=Nocardioides eburneus TaxID=3231482 RepID=A0ABV3SSW0_9ACTN